MSLKGVLVEGLVALGVLVAGGSSSARAESMYVFGVHDWDWGVNVDVMNWRTGWVTEASMAHDWPYVFGRHEPMAGEGFSIIQRLEWDENEPIPPDPADYPTFANQCATHWAREIKDFCRHYSIGNEVDLFDVSASEYAACFQLVRNAIKAEQPNARVLIGHWCAPGYYENVMQILPGGYDGLTAHTGSSVPDDLCNLLDQYNAPPDVGVYVTEWGWVADSVDYETSVARMMGFCQDLINWNPTHDRQVYGATWYRWPCWDSTFHLDDDCSFIDNPAFKYLTANCDAYNSYANNPVIISDVRVEVSTSFKALIVRWQTNHLSKTMLWYWNSDANPRNGEFIPLNTSLVSSHVVTMDNVIHVQPSTEYLMICRSPAWDLGDGSAGPFKVTTGPWTITVEDVAATSATVRWQTLFPSTSRVEYGQTTAYGDEVSDSSLVTDHVIQLEWLDPLTTYHYRVWSEADEYAPHHSADRMFETTEPTAPLIQVVPEEITVSGYVGADPPNSSFDIRNAGGVGMITYQITPDCSWLSVNPDSGTSTDEADTIEITYDTTGLSEDVHTCPITVEAPEATNSPLTAPVVTLTLTHLPADFDRDGDVDMEDFGEFQVCLTGYGITQNKQACLWARLDSDQDVDGDDLDIFCGCLSGPNKPLDPGCMP